MTRLRSVDADRDQWDPAFRQLAHAALDQCLDSCEHAVIVGVGRTHTFDKWLSLPSSNQLTLQMVVLRGFRREIEREESVE